MSDKPAWYNKHPCSGCSCGYLECAQFWTMSLKCCKACDHPSHRESNEPFTADEIADMQRYHAERNRASTSSAASS